MSALQIAQEILKYPKYTVTLSKLGGNVIRFGLEPFGIQIVIQAEPIPHEKRRWQIENKEELHEVLRLVQHEVMNAEDLNNIDFDDIPEESTIYLVVVM
ncbi:MAG: hypothetical protein V4658_04025 [Bacteroidota bacterium]